MEYETYVPLNMCYEHGRTFAVRCCECVQAQMMAEAEYQNIVNLEEVEYAE